MTLFQGSLNLRFECFDCFLAAESSVNIHDDTIFAY